MAKKKHVPALYTEPAPIKLEPRKLVAVDPKTRTITLEGSPPPELIEAAAIERRRMDLTARLKCYAATCLARVMPHFGERPTHIPATKWRDVEQRIRLIRELPGNAPPEARDALRALQTLHRLVDELVREGDFSEGMERAMCWAIDLGQLLQRGQVQIDHGTAADRGRRNTQAADVANDARAQKREARKRQAAAEYDRRKQENSKATKSGIIKQMSKVKGEDGTPKFGAERTLIRYLREPDSRQAAATSSK